MRMPLSVSDQQRNHDFYIGELGSRDFDLFYSDAELFCSKLICTRSVSSLKTALPAWHNNSLSGFSLAPEKTQATRRLSLRLRSNRNMHKLPLQLRRMEELRSDGARTISLGAGRFHRQPRLFNIFAEECPRLTTRPGQAAQLQPPVWLWA